MSDQERKMEQQRLEQGRFEKNLISYPSAFEPFLLQVLNNVSVKEKCSLGMLKLKEGIEITYKKEGNFYKGKLSHDVYCLAKDEKTFLMEGAEVVIYDGIAHFERFILEPFKEKWRKDELQPVLEKYALTVYTPVGDHQGPALESYERFKDIWDPDNNIIVFSIGEPRPEFIAWKGSEPYLIRRSGGFWNKRE